MNSNENQYEVELQIESTLSELFCDNPFEVKTNRHGKLLNVSVFYHDFLTDKNLIICLRKQCKVNNVQWDVNRSMSSKARNALLNELYLHPENLHKDRSLNGNIRMYIIDQFTSTDFE